MFLVPTGYRTNVNSDLISSDTDILFLKSHLKVLKPDSKISKIFHYKSSFVIRKLEKET